MSITTVLLNVADVERSVGFYTRFLQAQVVGEVTPEEALLDVVAATIRLVRVTDAAETGWVADDLQRGFRHVGFKVAQIDPMVAELKAAGVRFQLDPIDAEGGVRLTFFYDPDGTLLELVEGPLQYHEVFDQALVDADWALGTPDRPRFDHVAETVRDLAATRAHYAPLGFELMGGIHQPNDPRGYEIAFLRGGDTSLEIFTYDRADTAERAAQLDAPGFVAIGIGAPGGATGEVVGEVVGEVAGEQVVTDPDGLLRLVPASR